MVALRLGPVLVLAAILVAAALAPAAGAAAGPGCDPSRPAVAHTARGVRLSPQPGNPPIPCATIVGRTSEDADVGVLRSGAIVFAPLNENTAAPPRNVLDGPEWVTRSRDRGASWTRLDSGGPTTGGLVPPWMSVDPRTSRIWFATTLPTLCGARISWSDDGGRTWSTNPAVGCPAQGSNKLLEGPPPRSAPKPAGYPHVAYYCANGTDITSSQVYCYRSLDGGKTFSATASSPDPKRPPGCDERHPARPGVVAPDGTLYFPTQLCGTLGVAISRDEGDTWQQRTIARTDIADISLYISSAAVDARGDLYIAWIGRDNLPRLTISRDRGRTWTKPRKLVAPGVNEVRHVAITARRRGQIALSYLGSTDGKRFNGYITETANALAHRPVFWSAAVNRPHKPLIHGDDEETFGDRFFYGTDAFARGGAVWAGFHCAKTTACPGRRLGVAGRLTAPSNRFRIGRLTRNRRRGTAVLRVAVPGAGSLRLAGRRLLKAHRHLTRRRGVGLRVRGGRRARRALRHRDRVRLRARVTYRPAGGAARTKRTRVVLVRSR